MLTIKKAEVAATVVDEAGFPPDLGLDIVLAGRSNVGKSSLINRLINRKNLARTSSDPGKTRTLNFYSVNDNWYFVDLPGYGYAKVSHAEQHAFKKMVDNYFAANRPMVVWQLVDLRHSPSGQDRQMHEFIRHRALPYLVVATKADKLSKNRQIKAKSVIMRELNLKEEQLVVFSAATGLNQENLLNRIENYLKE